MRDVIKDEVRIGNITTAVRTDPDRSAIDPDRGRLVAQFTVGEDVGAVHYFRSFS